MTLTKEKLAHSIHNTTGYSKCRSSKMLDSLLAILKKTLQSGEHILVSGFGKFSVIDNRKVRGGSVRTRESVIPESDKSVIFKCSPVLKDKINRRLP